MHGKQYPPRSILDQYPPRSILDQYPPRSTLIFAILNGLSTELNNTVLLMIIRLFKGT